MSTAEPFMPADEPTPESPFEEFEIDPDADVDILRDAGDGSDEADEAAPDFASNPSFRTPHPGESLTGEQLQHDLDEE